MRCSLLAFAFAAVAAAPALARPIVNPIIVMPVLPTTKAGNGGNATTGNSGAANGGTVLQQGAGIVFNTGGSG